MLDSNWSFIVTVYLESILIAVVVLMGVFFVLSQWRFKVLTERLSALDAGYEAKFGSGFHPGLLSWSQQQEFVAMLRVSAKSADDERVRGTARQILAFKEFSQGVGVVYLIIMVFLLLVWR